MTLAEFTAILDLTEYPVAQLAFPADEAPEMPFIVYGDISSDNFGADNKVYSTHRRIQVDLFTKLQDSDSEDLLQSVFDDNDIYWDRVAAFDDDERFYRATYEVVI